MRGHYTHVEVPITSILDLMLPGTRPEKHRHLSWQEQGPRDDERGGPGCPQRMNDDPPEQGTKRLPHDARVDFQDFE